MGRNRIGMQLTYTLPPKRNLSPPPPLRFSLPRPSFSVMNNNNSSPALFTLNAHVAASNDSAAPSTVVDQVRLAFARTDRLAAVVGLLLGAFVPLACYLVSHCELSGDLPLYSQRGAYLVAGGLAYSAKTVWQWGTVAFKAAGFVVLLEGVMVTSHIAWLGIVALGYLMAINGVATAFNLIHKKETM
jgi:hypothetical protein